ncbi:MAG: response regulator [Patescibacteria group bacterium]|nr:response regulator [Patescibacteria group bacterium]
MKKPQNKILIVEDELYLLNVLSDKFKREGFRVAKASNGEKGLQMAIKNKPDLILLDIVMPLVDGVTMIKRMRADERIAHIPVIIISNLSEVERITEVLGAKTGVIEYLVKSHWSLEGVVRKVEETLQVYNLLQQTNVKK